jgi:hypothetical protein
VRYDDKTMRAAAGGGFIAVLRTSFRDGLQGHRRRCRIINDLDIEHEVILELTLFICQGWSRAASYDLQSVGEPLRNETRVTEELPTVTSVSRNDNLLYHS